MPEGFVYAVKGSRFISHMKKLANLDGAVKKYFTRIKPSRERIGIVLWQLPPNLKKDYARLDRFLQQLPGTYEHAVEFREPSWIDREIFELLQARKTTFVSVSSQRMPLTLEVTSKNAYIRFHGLAGGAAHDYTRKELELWAEHIRRQTRAGKTIYVYFNNDLNVRAPGNAKLLREMVGGKPFR